MKLRPIFICKANVWRSQIAEWIYNNLYGSGESISIAWSEARKEKYLWAPDTSVSKILKEYKWVDISTQKIKYLKDITVQHLSSCNLIVFLFDPEDITTCDDWCKLNWSTPYQYLKKWDIPILICPITDPFEVEQDAYKKIIDDIEKLIRVLPKSNQ